MTVLNNLVAASLDLSALPGRRAKIDRVADLLRNSNPADIAVVARWMTGEPARTALGIGPAQVSAARARATSVAVAQLGVAEVHSELQLIARLQGAGSKAQRTEQLVRLFAKATEQEQLFLSHLLLGELRQGALVGLMIEAIAVAFELPLAAVQRAQMLTGDIGRVAAVARADGRTGIDAIQLQLFNPVQPMLAQPATDLEQALTTLKAPVLEYKLDGARVQVHKRDAEVRVFSRQGNDVSGAVPELVEQIAALPVSDLVLDGETLTFYDDGRPRPFQTTMRRFGRRRDDSDLRRQLPIRSFFFDCLRIAGETLIDANTLTRQAALAEALPAAHIVPRLTAGSLAQAEDFLSQALATGHEGLMAKSPEAPYAAGGRGNHWLKLKQAHSLDLVVLAAEWGSGRRQGWLSNLHLGARTDDAFVMLGKTFKGLTDQLLAWQTEQLLAREIGRDGMVVHVRPELVVEIAFNELQRSRQYPAGLGLRFARVKRYRPDKPPAEADHLDQVTALFARQIAYQERRTEDG
ncbi:ATP-dependent DNA ligase [Halochromatium sp.]